jgi:hypothetical protein
MRPGDAAEPLRNLGVSRFLPPLLKCVSTGSYAQRRFFGALPANVIIVMYWCLRWIMSDGMFSHPLAARFPIMRAACHSSEHRPSLGRILDQKRSESFLS